MKNAVVGERSATKYITPKLVEGLRDWKERKKLHWLKSQPIFFSESSQTEWQRPFNFPTGLKCPKEMISTLWELDPWVSGENSLDEQEPITNSTHIWFVAYRIRTQATLTAMLATNIDFSFYATPYCPCITFFCSNKSTVIPQVTLFLCVNEYTVFLMRKQAAQRLIIFATHAAS